MTNDCEMRSLISIIVPVYNVEKYLDQCVQSILSQTYKNFELILVDDGSADNSGKMCDAYAEHDYRIKVIHKNNGGLSDARNIGIKMAVGEFITFIDSDDYITSKYLEVLMIAQEQYHADIVQGEMTRKTEELCLNSDLVIEVMESSEAFRSLLRYERATVYACGKLYRRRLFTENAITYPVGRLNEDCATTYKLFLVSDTIAFIPYIIYFYRDTPNSIMNSCFSVKRLDIWKVPDEMYDYLGSCMVKYSNDLLYYKFRIGINLINESLNSRDIEVIRKRKEIIEQIMHMNVMFNGLNMKYTLIYIFIRLCPNCYCFLIRLLRG